MKVGRGTGPLPSPGKNTNVRKVTAAGGRDQASKDKKKGGNQGKSSSSQTGTKDSILGTDLSENQATIDNERPDMSILSAPFPTIDKFIDGPINLGDVKSLSFTLTKLERTLPALKYDSILLQLGEDVRDAFEGKGQTFQVLTQKLNHYQNLMNQNKLF